MAIPRVLPYRLRRRPSPLGEIAARLGLTIVWNLLVGGVAAVAWLRHREETPTFIFAVLGFMVLVGIGLIWDVVARAGRAALGRTTVVEIDRLPVTPGVATKVRICEPHPSSFATLDLDLVRTVRQVAPGVVTIRDVPEKTLFAASPGDLAGDAALDRTLELELPRDDGAAETLGWQIYVSGRLRQGGVMISRFPLAVAG